MTAFRALVQNDLRLALRNKSVIFFNYFFPLIFFFMFGQLFDAGRGNTILQIVTMVTAIGVISNGLFGAGIRAIQDRETNILRRFKVTPILPLDILVSSTLTGVILYLPAFALTLVLASIVYGMHMPANLTEIVIFVAIACAAFRCIGLIVASVVNSSQESAIVLQPVFFIMFFLSGASMPITLFPKWLQIVTQFIPATYLMTGVGGMLERGESLAHNWAAVVALLLTAVVATFISTRLFRWEKEEKLKPAAKLWVVAALCPFFVLGGYQAWSQQNLAKTRILQREISRGRNTLIRNARIITGTGRVIDSGAVLIQAGKIAHIFEGASPDGKTLNADTVDSAGKTILPGLIDVHVHLGNPGGFPQDYAKFDAKRQVNREVEAYLASGVVAVRSAGDELDMVTALRSKFNSGQTLGTELFVCGPIFTAPNGHGTEYARYMPENMRANFNAQFLRIPKTPDEARHMVDDLASQHVDAIKAILDAGNNVVRFERLDLNIFRAIVDEAHARHLPVAVHTGTAKDVDDAVAAGVESIEHGSYTDVISDATLGAMAAHDIAFDPTLSVVEAMKDFSTGDLSLLKRPMVMQVTSPELIAGTNAAATDARFAGMRQGYAQYPMSLEIGGQNLVRAWKAGVPVATGSDAGNVLVLHGPTVQHEIELWVKAGIPPAVALQGATINAARVLRAENRLGTIEVGKDASLIEVDGNPLQDPVALTHLSNVFFKGEKIDGREIFTQE